MTLTTTMVWFAITRYNIRENNLHLPKNLQNNLRKFIENDFDKLTMWGIIAVFVVAILAKYGDSIFM